MIKHHRWTDEERNVVRCSYDGTKISAERIGDRLGLSGGAVMSQAMKLGLQKSCCRRWEEREIAFLEENLYKLSIPKIASALKRSKASVRLKAERLRLLGRKEYRDDWYNKQDVCEILGINHVKVQFWIDEGKLKATRHNIEASQTDGYYMWHIERDDLRKFIINHSSELLGRNVDIQQVVWLLTNEAISRA